MEFPIYQVRLAPAMLRRAPAWPWAAACGLLLNAAFGWAAPVAGKSAPADAGEKAAPKAKTGSATASAPAPAASTPTAEPAAPEGPPVTMYIREYAVTGAKSLPRIDIEEAVYPFLGPGRTYKDVELARQALENAYLAKGMTPYTKIIIPQQSYQGGLVILKAVEGEVGSLRVLGARYYLPSRIKAQARSLAEGKVLVTDNISHDIVALNQVGDRQAKPKLAERPDEPGKFDMELHVKDKLPFHGSVELNNRNSPNTTDLRLNVSMSYANLWQRGHTLGLSYQTSPEDRSEVKVYSAYYIWRFENVDWLSVMFTGTKQDSDVSTLGGVAVAGRGEIMGVQAIATLPGKPNFYHTLNVGIDYKNFDQNVVVGATTDVTPISYYPLTIGWDGTWLHNREADPDKPGDKRVELGFTELNLTASMHFRGLGSTNESLERNRFNAEGNYFLLRGSLAHEHELPGGWQAYGKIHGQAANQPLVNSEQIAGGGLDTVRGYLEAEALGDSGIFGTLELRTPSLLPMRRTRPKTDAEIDEESGGENTVTESTGNEWRFYAFFDAGKLNLQDPLPDQEHTFDLASWGIGSEIQLRKHLHGIVELALPLTSLTNTGAHDARINFRLWLDF